MKTINVTTTYTLFKPVPKPNGVDSTIHFVRITSSTTPKITWFMGYENVMGSVSIVGGDLSKQLNEQLETEYRNSIK